MNLLTEEFVLLSTLEESKLPRSYENPRTHQIPKQEIPTWPSNYTLGNGDQGSTSSIGGPGNELANTTTYS